ncbi:MAG: hypothetical protein H7831_11375 [Magnetococcus sp. WYHC-3]
MVKLFSSKRVYFATFGAVGGFLSALLYTFFELRGVYSTWVVGTGFDGLCIGAFLALGQFRYAGKLFEWRPFRMAVVIGGLGGMIGGLVALIFGLPLAQFLGGGSDAGRFLGWALGGSAVGLALSRVVPNLKWLIGTLAGGLGGFIGCGLMYLMASLAAGTATTGAAIGLAIALAESAFRQHWLEITIRPKGLTLEKERTLTMTIGEKPILFGCAGDADVKLAEMVGAKAHFAKVSLVSGKIVLLDMARDITRNLSVNEVFEVSNAKVVVRAKENARQVE